jgi:hypothetical protein
MRSAATHSSVLIDFVEIRRSASATLRRRLPTRVRERSRIPEARRATSIRVRAGVRSPRCNIEIVDDGAGGASRAGIVGLRDRVETAGGRLEI